MVSLSKLFIIALIGLTLLTSVYAVAPGPTPITYHVVAKLKINPDSGNTAVNYSFDPSSSYCYYYSSTGYHTCSLTSEAIDYGDGNSNARDSPPSITYHKYSNPGVYTISLEVCHYGTCSSTQKTLAVANQPPTADAGENASTKVNHLVLLNGSGTDPDGSIVLYEWDFNGDGKYDWSSTTTGITYYNYTKTGTYRAVLRVTDNNSATDTDSVIITVVPNKPPIADAGSNRTALVNESISFNANDSYDPDGTIVSYDWNFGDGTTGSGVATSHSYSSPGNYTITLTVTDNDGATSTDNVTITVLEKPVAVIKANVTQGQAPLTVLFNANSSYDSDGTIISYYWDFGDGTNSTQIEAIHTYSIPGEYNATLTVTDNDNLTSIAYILINVTNATQNQNPFILSFSANVTNGSAPLDVEFKGAATDNQNLGYILIFDINNYGDNVTGAINSTESTLGEHTYTSIGNYTARLIVEDGLGGVNSSDIIIEVVNATNNTGNGNNSTIINQPPVANFTYINSTYYTFSFTDLSTDSDGNITSWLWNFGDGTTSNQQNPEHNFAKTTANYTVTLTVTDNNGSQSNYSQTIKVIKLPSNNNQNSYNGGGWIWTPKKNKTNENITANATNGTTAGNQTNETSNSTASETANQNGSSVQKAIPITTAGSGTAVTGLATGVFNDPTATPLLTFLSIAAIGLFAFGKIGLGKGAVSIKKLIKTRSIKRKK